MGFFSSRPPPLLLLLFSLFSAADLIPSAAAVPRHLLARELFLVESPPLILTDHNGALLMGNYSVHLYFYGNFSAAKRAVVVDFVHSLSPSSGSPPPPSVASWWSTISLYRDGPSQISLGRVILDEGCSRGKSLTDKDLLALATEATPHKNSIVAIITADDVLVSGFCMSRCGVHDDVAGGKHGKSRYTYLWVGDSIKQCPGVCAWPFSKPLYGPQGAVPLIPPNGDVGIDGVILNFATLIAGVVTNPYGDGYFQGEPLMPMEAVTACTGIFGNGAYPGFTGELLKDSVTGASYNAKGLAGREYLIPAIWSPKTKECTTAV